MPPNQYQPQQNYQMPMSPYPSKEKRHGHLLLPFIIVILLFLASLTFAVWAFAGRLDLKNNFDKKVEAEIKVAVQKEATRKDNEFAEREKSPVKTYVGPETYGSVRFQYPKTWSGYVIEKSQGGITVNAYFHPNVVPDAAGETAFALRVQVVDKAYDDVLGGFESAVKSGEVKVRGFSPAKIKNVVGSRVDGEIFKGEQDSMIILPLRDKTIQIWTESKQFIKDFENIILPNLTFIP